MRKQVSRPEPMYIYMYVYELSNTQLPHNIHVIDFDFSEVAFRIEDEQLYFHSVLHTVFLSGNNTDIRCKPAIVFMQ